MKPGAALHIALRNLFAHKSKTLIIGGIILLSSTVITLGNVLLITVQSSMKQTYTEKFTGDIVIVADERDESEVLPGPDLRPAVPDLSAALDTVNELVGAENTVAVLPQLNGFSMLNLDGQMIGIARLLASDPELYRETFIDTIEITGGAYPTDENPGIMIDAETVAMMGRGFRGGEGEATEVSIGDTILLTTQNDVTGTKIREVAVTGTYRWTERSNETIGITFIDPNNLRTLNGFVLNTPESLNLDAEGEAFLATDDIDSFFSADATIVESGNIVQEEGAGDIFNILGDTSVIHNTETDPDAYTHIIIRLANPSRASGYIAKLNRAFDERGLAARAVDWTAAAGGTAMLVSSFQYGFNAVILMISIVSIIIIMNTMIISVAERIGEIGTLRAIGGHKGFIIRMIFSETTMISALFGAAGMLIGILLYYIVANSDIAGNNFLIRILFSSLMNGQGFAPAGLVLPFLTVILTGVVSGIYPALVAAGMSPLTAMNKR